MPETFDNARSVKSLTKSADRSFLVRPIGESAAENPRPLDAESDLVTRQTLAFFVFLKHHSLLKSFLNTIMPALASTG
jgi:hypothetical protein